MELSYGSEFNKEDFEKRIKMIEDYDGSLADRSPYENWEQVNIEQLALENQKKKRVKSVDSRRAYASFKHLRGRHDQLDHAWNRGMGRGSSGGAVGESGLSKMMKYRQTRAALLDKVRTGEMTRVEAQTQLRAMRDTLGDMSPTRREEFAVNRANTSATQAVPDAPTNERKVQEIRDELKSLTSQRDDIQQRIDGINATNSAAITNIAIGNRSRLVSSFFTTALMVMLENTDGKYSLSKRFEPHLQEISEAYSSTNRIFINPNDIGLASRIASSALENAREMKMDGIFARYRYESSAQTIMSFLVDFNNAIDAAGLEVLDNQPDFALILTEAAFVKSLTTRESTPASTMEELIRETSDFNSSYDMLINNDMVSESEKQILQENKKIANDFVEQTRNEIANREAVSASLAPQLQQLDNQIAELKNDIKNIAPDLADISNKYSDNPLYQEELFSDDAKQYSQKAAEVTKRLIDNAGGKFDSIAMELSLNLNNPQDIEILSDLLGVFIDPTDNLISQTNMGVNYGDANDNISYAADIKNEVDETVITSSRYISYDANDDSIEISNNIFKQNNLSGIGYAMRVRQTAAAMEVARRTGRKVRISTYAVSNGVDYFGFHVWPKLGYDFPIPPEIQAIISDLGFYQLSTNELMLSAEKAESASGQYSQFDGMTPLQFWAEVVERAGGNFGVNGYITIEPDSQEEQLLALEAQVLQKYSDALARKQKKAQKSYSKSAYNKYLEEIGFSADELDMFDEAWESVRKSLTKKPKKEKAIATQKFKHLRGRHDQLDHAWNRGMGGGGAGGAATGGLSKMMKYRQTRAALLDMVRTGDMTRNEAREQLRAMRETLGDMSPTRREDFSAGRAENMGLTSNVTRGGGSAPPRIGYISVPQSTSPNSPLTGKLTDIQYVQDYFRSLLTSNSPNTPNLQNIINMVRQTLSGAKNIPPPTPIPTFTSTTYDANVYDSFLTMTTRGDNASSDIPHTIQDGTWLYNEIPATAEAEFKALDKKFGITTWKLNETEDIDLVNEIMKNRQEAIRIKGELAVQILDYSNKVNEFNLIQDVMQNLVDASQVINQSLRMGRGVSQSDANTYAFIINEVINNAIQMLATMETQIENIEKNINNKFGDLMKPIHGNTTISPAMMRFLRKHFGASVNPNIQTKPFTPDDIVVLYDKKIQAKDKTMTRQLVNDANDFVDAFIDKQLLPDKVDVVFDNREKEYFESPVYYWLGKNAGRIVVNRFGFDVPTLLHELMHAISDESRPRAYGPGFLNTGKDPAITQKFNNLVWGFFKTRFDKNTDIYDANDPTIGMWAEDNFPDYYIGILGGMNGKTGPVEIISMGISMLLVDPIKFAKTQPDYFRFLSVLLSGAWIKP